MENTMSCCGVICGGCKDYQNGCDGCNAAHGEPYWTAYVGIQVCPIYKCCVTDKEYAHCGKCKAAPCRIYSELKDPTMTDDEHQQTIVERMAILKSV